MTDTPFDQNRERMIAALCGELSDAERRELEKVLDRDEALRRELEELEEAQAFLRHAGGEAPPAAFTFTFPDEAAVVTSGARHGRVIPLWRWAMASAAGFAAAATLFAGLLIAGLRVDHTPQGVLVSFASRDRAQASGQPGAATDPDPSQAAAGAPLALPDEYLTRAEFEGLAQGMLQLTALRLDQLEQRQVSTQTATARALYEALAVSQQLQYDDLRTRLEQAVLYAAWSPSQQSLGAGAADPRLHRSTQEEQRHDYD